jgi:hypothetical protein
MPSKTSSNRRLAKPAIKHSLLQSIYRNFLAHLSLTTPFDKSGIAN